MRPALLVIAGPNGAGKTTVTARLREEAVLKAARWADARREALLAAGSGIAFETVLSTSAKIDFVARAKDRGYFVRVFFIGTSDPRINASRIAGRFMGGGHSVPIDKIVSRYARSMANLSAVIRLADRTYVYDNSIENVEARLCFRTQDGQLRKVYCELPDWVADGAQLLVRHPEFVDMRAA